MPQEEDGGASWKSRRSTQVAASVLLLIDSHPLVLSNMVRPGSLPDLNPCVAPQN